MATLRTNVVGCPVILYDSEGNRLATCEVIKYNNTEMRLEIDDVPDIIKTGEVYDILIICPPTPWEYKGRVSGSGFKRELALFQGKTKECRSAQRFKVEFPAGIESYVSDGQIYKMHTPVTVKVINISRTGFRFVAKPNTAAFGDIFHMRMKISPNNEKQLEAEVVNTIFRNDLNAEFGCRFLSEGGVPSE